MKLNIVRLIALTAFIGLSGGCKENPQLVRKSKEQIVEIESLKSELAALQEKLKDAPSDQTKILELAKAEEAALIIKLKELELEVSRLSAQRDKAKAELDNFLKQRNH